MSSTPHFTRTGQPSILMGRGRSFKRYMRIEKVVRMEVAGMRDADIAMHLGCTVPALHHIKKSHEYAAKRIEILHGILSEQDTAMREDGETLTAELKAMLPQAVGTIRTVLTQGNRFGATLNEQKLAITVAQDLMDREGTLAKVSRTKVEREDVPSLPPQIAVDLLAALQSASEARRTGNSEVMDVFVKAAGLTAETQANLQARMKLEDFDVTPETSRQ